MKPWTLLLFAVLVSGIVSGTLCAFATLPMLRMATNADMLVPVSFAWDALHQPGGFGSYRLPRIPSLLPDGVLLLLGFAVAGVSRASLLVYGGLQFALFVFVGGWVVGGLAGRPALRGAAVLFALLAAMLPAELWWQQDTALLGVFLPVIHFGPAVAALGGGWAVARCLHAPGRRWLLLVGSVSALFFLSDKLILPEFILPAVAACVVVRVTDGVPWRRVLSVLAALAAGLVLGGIVFRVLGHVIRVEGSPTVSVATVAASVAAFWREWPGFVTHHRVGFALGMLLPLAGWASFPLCWRGMAPPGRRVARSCWVLATASMLATAAFTACLYSDTNSYRYALLCWVWPLMFLGVVLLRHLKPPLPGLAATVAACGLAVAFLLPQRGALPILSWEHPLASCVRSLRGPLGLRAGLAQYWVARPLEFSLGWDMQVDQLFGPGVAFPWQTDARWYRQALHDPGRPPAYDFIILQDLDPKAVRARYGAPARVVPCGGTEFWIYDDDRALQRAVIESNPSMYVAS